MQAQDLGQVLGARVGLGHSQVQAPWQAHGQHQAQLLLVQAGEAASKTGDAPAGAVSGASACSSPIKLSRGGRATLITGDLGAELPRPTPRPTPRPMARAAASISSAMQAQRLRPHGQGLAAAAGLVLSLPVSMSLTAAERNLL